MIILNKVKDTSLYAILAKIDNNYYEISKEMDILINHEFNSNIEVIFQICDKNKSISFYILENIFFGFKLPFRIYEFKQMEEDKLPDIYIILFSYL